MNVPRIVRLLPAAFLVLAAAVTPAGAQESAEPVTLDFTPQSTTAVQRSGRSAAPADVNFGRYPLSVIGIENVIRRADRDADAYAQGDDRIDDGPIAYAVVAIRDWERRYPADPWIAKDLLALARFYAHVGTPQTRDAAGRVVAWLRHDYPDTPYARSAGR